MRVLLVVVIAQAHAILGVLTVVTVGVEELVMLLQGLL